MGQYKVVKLGLVDLVEPDGDCDVGLAMRMVKVNAPALAPTGQGLTARHDQADDQFLVQMQQVRFRVTPDRTTQLGNAVLGALHDLRVQTA